MPIAAVSLTAVSAHLDAREWGILVSGIDTNQIESVA